MVRDGTVLGVGTGTDSVGGRGTDYVVGAWRSTDAMSWQVADVADADIAGPVFATDDEFVMLAAEFVEIDLVTVELRSSDGISWQRHDVGAAGFIRSAAAYRAGTAVAIGDVAPWSGSPSELEEPRQLPGRASNVWIHHD